MAQSMKMTKGCAVTRRPEQAVHARCAARSTSVKPAPAQWANTSSASRQAFGPAAPSRCLVTRVAAAEAPEAASTSTKSWYALVANAEFFCNEVQNESVAEQLRERVRFFKEQDREIDFWLVPEPKWLDAKFPKEAKMVKRPCVALISTDETWITFMKLRLDRVLRINLGAVSQEEALAVGGEIPEFKQPEKWTAPYPPYSKGWWKVFLPK